MNLRLSYAEGKANTIRICIIFWLPSFKVDLNSRLPLAIGFDTIEVSDVTYTRQIITRAVSNLSNHAKIVSVAMYRGFLDGQDLWWLHEHIGVHFYIPAKTNLAVYKDALSLTGTAVVQTRPGLSTGLPAIRPRAFAFMSTLPW
jgi:hypothetical protein